MTAETHQNQGWSEPEPGVPPEPSGTKTLFGSVWFCLDWVGTSTGFPAGSDFPEVLDVSLPIWFWFRRLEPSYCFQTEPEPGPGPGPVPLLLCATFALVLVCRKPEPLTQRPKPSANQTPTGAVLVLGAGSAERGEGGCAARVGSEEPGQPGSAQQLLLHFQFTLSGSGSVCGFIGLQVLMETAVNRRSSSS